jgi:hypothetical protein
MRAVRVPEQTPQHKAELRDQAYKVSGQREHRTELSQSTARPTSDDLLTSPEFDLVKSWAVLHALSCSCHQLLHHT